MYLQKLTVKAKLTALVAVSGIAFFLYGVWSWNTLSVAKVHGPYYDRIEMGKDLIADILPPPNYIIESYLMALHMANEVEEGASQAQLKLDAKRCKELEKKFLARHEYWKATLPEGEMKHIKSVNAFTPAREFYRVLDEEFIPACLRGDVQLVEQLERGVLGSLYDEHRNAVDRVVIMAQEYNKTAENEVASLVQRRAYISVAAIIFLTLSMISVGMIISRDTVNPLVASAARLQELSKYVRSELLKDAEETSAQAIMASSAAEEVSVNTRSLATAVEQFELSIKEISHNASSAVSTASEAVSVTQETSARISQLGSSSSEIGEVIKTISAIASQTNLLALNATIESARAGEAGKGFAVVANEVKDLAADTSRAADEIITKIEAIQSDTHMAIEAIARASTVIGQIAESQNAIAGAVEEQSAMTGEISKSIGEVAAGSSEIARSVSAVSSAAMNTTSGSGNAVKTASDLEDMAIELLRLVGEIREEPVEV
ncbi:methyl-accepting chemotaxis protein [Stieleria sp. JC731]|uniref:methyl-accepting chemotaxis protein n=1 Tax=Pirellulaceae TaxID=2691357 RepID=UPI001E410F93|nr:methyl-accepting chemotaxis protein [Stieleria sp. JC731]MCC9603587.1 methyl-accepting chemotaxis protein [Stieleria sp. JC731]